MSLKGSSPACPLCVGRSSLLYPGTVVSRDYFFQSGYNISGGNTKETLDIYQCETCGFGFSETGLSESELTAYYARQPEDRTYLKEVEGRRKTFRNTLKRIEKMLGRKGHVLDYGGGPGVFLSEAKKRGWEVDGVEAAEWARIYAKKEFGISCMSPGQFTEALESKRLEAKYDSITLFDVIEHVHDPARLIQMVSLLLKPGGVLLVTTPRFESITRKILGRRWYFLFPAHIWYFNKRSLETLLRKNSLTPQHRHWHVFHFTLGYIAARLGFLLPKNVSQIEVPFCFGEEWEVYARLTPEGPSTTL